MKKSTGRDVARRALNSQAYYKAIVVEPTREAGQAERYYVWLHQGAEQRLIVIMDGPIAADAFARSEAKAAGCSSWGFYTSTREIGGARA